MPVYKRTSPMFHTRNVPRSQCLTVARLHPRLLHSLSAGAQGLQALCDLDISLNQGHTSSTQSRSSSPLPGEKGSSHTTPLTRLVGGLKLPTGLTLLQGMVLLGPDGRRRVEEYTSRGKGGPAGIGELLHIILVVSAVCPVLLRLDALGCWSVCSAEYML